MSVRLLCCSGSLEGGGSERQSFQLATGLDRDVFSPQFYLHYRRGTFLHQLPPDLPVHDFWSRHQEFRPAVPGAIHQRQVADLAGVVRMENIDVVYDRTFHMTLVTGPACRRTNTPRVSVIVSPPSFDFVRSREKFAWFKKRCLRKAYLDPSAVTVAVSDAVARDAEKFYRLPAGAVHVVPSPVDTESILALAKLRDPLARQTPLRDADDFRVCVVGRLSSEKGQASALGAFAAAFHSLADRNQRAGWHLDLVGDGPDRESLQKLASKLNIVAQVTFHGFVENPYPLIASADLLLLPSDYEGLPNVVLEAMVLRTPVVATECSDSLQELLGTEHTTDSHRRGCLVPVGDEAAMAAAMLDRASSQNPDSRVQWMVLADQAFEYVQSHHSLSTWLERMSQLLLDQANGTSASRQRGARE